MRVWWRGWTCGSRNCAASDGLLQGKELAPPSLHRGLSCARSGVNQIVMISGSKLSSGVSTGECSSMVSREPVERFAVDGDVL